MKKVSTLLMLFFAIIGATWAQDMIVNGIKQIPTVITAPDQIQTGYYLLKQVNNNQDCAGGKAVGFIKFNTEAVGTIATSKGTSATPKEVNYVWYVEVKSNGNITISTANKKASWHLPSRAQRVKPLVEYAQRTELVRVTTKPNPLSSETTAAPKANSCYLRNTEGNAYVHFSGNDLGSWTSAGVNSTFMVEFYQLDPNTHLDKTDLTAKDKAIIYLKETLKLAEAYKNTANNTWLLGEGLNKYSQQAGDADFVTTYKAAKAMADNPTGPETAEQVTAKDNELKTLISHLTINQPTTGRFYAFKNKASGSFVDGTIAKDFAATSVVNNNDFKAGHLFYLTNDKKILGYATGYYFINTRQIGQGTANTWKFLDSSGNKGFYMLQSNAKGMGTLLYGWAGSKENKCDRNGAYAANNCDWTIVEVTTLPVTVSAAGWATLYAPVALTIPSGVTAYTGKVNGNALKLTALTNTIPANTPVLLKANAATYNFPINYEAAAQTIDQSLKGTIETIAKPAQGTIFTLQKDATAGLGLFKFTGTNLQGFRIYGVDLLGSTSAAAGLVFEFDDVTGIDGITMDDHQQTVIYDLSGRRVAKAQKGMYIINGKKVIIR